MLREKKGEGRKMGQMMGAKGPLGSDWSKSQKTTRTHTPISVQSQLLEIRFFVVYLFIYFVFPSPFRYTEIKERGTLKSRVLP